MAIASAGKDRLEALDLLRGLAALAVLIRHYPWPDREVLLLPRSYLAVDLFFVLSGFVIAYTYQQRLESGMPVGRYLLARLIRLYPLYLFATLLAAAHVAIQLVRHGPIEDFGRWGSTLATAVLFLPTPPAEWSLMPTALYPLNYAAWSLLFELVVNVLYGVLALRLTGRLLAALIAAGAILVGVTIAQFGSLDFGAGWESGLWGVGRALLSFFVGVAVFRWRERIRLPAVPAWLVGLALIAALLPPPGDRPWLYDLVCVGVLFPLLVWAAADASGGRRSRAVARQLGFVSYPIYVLQMALIPILAVLMSRAFGIKPTDSIAGGLLLQLAFVVGISWLVGRWFDEPVRTWLKRRSGLPLAPPPAQSAP